MSNSLILRASKFVMNCYTTMPSAHYPHVGDIQWLVHGDENMLSEDRWRFWQDETGRDVGACWLFDDEFDYALAPYATDGLRNAIRQWALEQILNKAKAAGEENLTVWETAVSTDKQKIAILQEQDYQRQDHYYLKLERQIDDQLPQPTLPMGFTIRHIEGDSELEARAALHRDSFLPHSSKTVDIAIKNHHRAMQTPFYDSTLDLVIVAPDGTLACGGICWFDPINKTGLFEPVGTRPAFRRMGLAKALMLAGLQRLKAKGATKGLVTALHPGSSGDKFPIEFTSSRHVFQQAGFKPVREQYLFNKTYPTT